MTAILPEAVARRFDWAALDADHASIVVLDATGTIVWANRAWFRFFEENAEGHDPASVQVGASYPEAIAGSLGEYYARVFDECRRSGQPFEQDYECSSPTEQRLYRLRVLPVEGVVIVSHHLRVVSPHVAAGGRTDLARYVRADGILVQCSNCRRVRTTAEGTWEWVPEVVASPPRRVSHGLCHLCDGFYFGLLPD